MTTAHGFTGPCPCTQVSPPQTVIIRLIPSTAAHPCDWLADEFGGAGMLQGPQVSNMHGKNRRSCHDCREVTGVGRSKRGRAPDQVAEASAGLGAVADHLGGHHPLHLNRMPPLLRHHLIRPPPPVTHCTRIYSTADAQNGYLATTASVGRCLSIRYLPRRAFSWQFKHQTSQTSSTVRCFAQVMVVSSTRELELRLHRLPLPRQPAAACNK